MNVEVPDSHRDLLEGPVLVSLATVMPDGGPQLSVVWCGYEGQHLLINTVRGRQKERNMRARPSVAVLAVDPKNPYRFVEARGAVEEITEDGAVEHIDELARIYTGHPAYYGHAVPAERRQLETRVICKIRPTRVRTAG